MEQLKIYSMSPGFLELVGDGVAIYNIEREMNNEQHITARKRLESAQNMVFLKYTRILASPVDAPCSLAKGYNDEMMKNGRDPKKHVEGQLSWNAAAEGVSIREIWRYRTHGTKGNKSRFICLEQQRSFRGIGGRLLLPPLRTNSITIIKCEERKNVGY
ncbi:hypothetical protein GQR58_024817 [Nymphon striatum]|nr:hypothetical protein GQR58_024817 [Nymphon striatum]